MWVLDLKDIVIDSQKYALIRVQKSKAPFLYP